MFRCHEYEMGRTDAETFFRMELFSLFLINTLKGRQERVRELRSKWSGQQGIKVLVGCSIRVRSKMQIISDLFKTFKLSERKHFPVCRLRKQLFFFYYHIIFTADILTCHNAGKAHVLSYWKRAVCMSTYVYESSHCSLLDCIKQAVIKHSCNSHKYKCAEIICLYIFLQT